MTIQAIPPPALPGSGSRVESLRLSSQPGNTELPVPFISFRFQVYSEICSCQDNLIARGNSPRLRLGYESKVLRRL
jgi:hypothetical protein